MESYSGNDVVTEFLKRFRIHENERPTLSDEETWLIFEQCQDTIHTDAICDLLYPERTAPEHACSAIAGVDHSTLQFL